MSRSAMTQAPTRHSNGTAAHTRSSGSFGPSTEMPVPNTPAFEQGRGRAGASPFELARSPPNPVSNKNTKHVPCKFFRQGACQAGNACPFSHSIDPMMHQAPCKYFMKGNCKFGHKCALAHYLPNGERVSKAHLNAGLARNNAASFGVNVPEPPVHPPNEGFVEPPPYPSSGYHADYFPESHDPFLIFDDDGDAPYNNRYSQQQRHTHVDSTVNSPPTSQFGSPPNENGFHRSTADNLRSALTAPLPASFNANSLPHIAKYGPFGQSVPDKFGLKSPPTSVLSKKLGSPESVLGGKISNIGAPFRNTSSPLTLSPQLQPQDSIGQKIMHSQRTSKPRMISASLPRTSLYDWDESVAGDATACLPESLHDDVMLPQDRMRRLSRADQESASGIGSGLSIPKRASATVGSPPTGSSPSRFQALFEEQERKKSAVGNTTNQPFGHVGSPLRESWMSPDPETTRSVSMSGISQAIARVDLTRGDSSGTNGSARPFGAVRNSSGFGAKFGTLASPGLNGRRLDEEGEGIFFEMDEDGGKRQSHTTWQLPTTSGGTRDRKPDDVLPLTNETGTRPIFGVFGRAP